MRRLRWLGLLLAVACAQATAPEPAPAIAPARAIAAPALAAPPRAARRPTVIRRHDDEFVDDFFWLRQKENPEVRAYLEAESAYADAVMKPTEALQEKLYGEILSRIEQTDVSVPTRAGEYFYYSRTEEGKQYPIHCRRRGSVDGPEQVILDVNALAEGHDFAAVWGLEPSDDGSLLAYTVDYSGFRRYTLRVKDLQSGELLPDRVDGVTSIAWAGDGKSLFYAVEDGAKRPYRVYRHVLGAKSDPLVHQERDGRFEVRVRRSRSRNYVFLDVGSLTSDEVWFLPAAQPATPPRPVARRSVDHQYSVEHSGERFYVRSNRGGRNFAVYTAPSSDPGEARWRPLLPHSDRVMIEDQVAYRRHLVVLEREDGIPQLRVIDLESGAQHRVEMPEPVRSVYPDRRQPFDSLSMRYRYESLVTPLSVFDYELDSRKQTLVKRQQVPGYDPSRYGVERLRATASDGTRIPVSVLRLRGQAGEAAPPAVLTGYGSYGVPYWIGFDPAVFSLVDRGVVFAVAHIRGGGELGKAWHDDGRMSRKMNTFTDFIAAAQELIARGYARSDRLGTYGGSAGGLLMGAVVNLRPDLWSAVILEVPFVDVLNSMSDPSLPLTITEFEEWGNPARPDEYAWIKRYCPYTNLAARDYPAMLVRTSFNDSQVMYWEPAKYTARLRTLRTDHNTFIFKTNMAGGHGGRSGRYDQLRDTAFDYAFLLTELGVE